MITARELRLIRLVRALRTGNPYHDPATGEFTSGSGGGHGDPAKRARRRARRKRRLERLRKRFKAEAKELKDSHAWERKERRKDERADYRRLRAETRKEWNSTLKQARKDVAKAGTSRERNEIRARAREDLANLKTDYSQRKSDLKAEHASQRKTDAASHHEEWESFRDDLKSAIADEGFRPRKRHLDGDPAPGGRSAAVPDPVERRAGGSPRFSAGRTHKASSAEAILRHCLRQLGLTRRYRDGRLTGRQARRLVEAIRRYGRAWLRHEAEQFAAEYLDVGASRALAADMAANFSRFFRRAKQFVRELIISSVMSLLGPAPLTGEELEAAEREATRQDQFFDRFEAELQAKGEPGPRPAPEQDGPVPPMTPAQFWARVEKYADSSWQAAQRINRTAAIQQGVAKMEMRVLGTPKTEHCDDCPPLAGYWAPIGTLPAIGESECGPLCLCHFVYQDAAGNRFFQGKGGPVPAPKEAPAPPRELLKTPRRPATKADIDKINEWLKDWKPTFNVKVIVGQQ